MVKKHGTVQIIEMMCDRRLDFLRRLDTFDTFGKRWTRRVEGVRATALAMATGKKPPEIKPSVEFTTTRKGSRGLWVRKLQQALEIQVDGVFGRDTEAELKAWQEAQGLQADGIAGRNTYRALGLLA